MTDFNDSQRQALLDLIILAMYADGHLTSVEDAKVERLLTAMGYTEPYDRQRQLDAAVTRVRQDAETPARAMARALELAESFAARDQQQRIYTLLEELITSDAHITAAESQLLEAIRARFKM